MHIGLIGGIGPAATDFYYRGLIDRHVASGIPLEATICHADVREMSRNLADRAPARQAAIFARLVERMKAAGAGAAAITSMGGHFCVDALIAISPLPVLNAIPEVGAEMKRRGLRRIGIMGTRTVMESRLYGSLTSIDVMLPEGDALDRVHAAYVAMATVGRVDETQRRLFVEEGEKLCRDHGAEAIMLGGTDLFLAFEGIDPGFPLIDCADIHVSAIYRTSSG